MKDLSLINKNKKLNYRTKKITKQLNCTNLAILNSLDGPDSQFFQLNYYQAVISSDS